MPDAVERSSGSRVRLPVSTTRLMLVLAIGVLLVVGGESSCKLATAGPELGWPTTHAPASGAQRSPRGATQPWPGGGWSGGWRPPGCRSGTLKRRRDSIRALTTEEP